MVTPLEFHTGYDVVEKRKPDGQTLYESTCPFCEKEGHFHFFDTTQFGCKVCGEKGNVYELIKQIYHKHTVADIGELAKERKLPERAMADFRYNKLNGTVIVPTFNKGTMNNLYKVVKIEGKYRLLGTPGLTQTLYNWPETSEDEVWMCEGQWDKCAAVAIIGTTHNITPISIPGANTMKDSWCGAFAGKDVVLIFDNDDAGRKGMEKAIKVFEESAQKPRSLKKVVWPASSPEKYDLRDFWIEHGRKSYGMLKELIKPIESPEAVKITMKAVEEDYSCDSYDKALTSFESAFHTTVDMRAALACVMASIYSIRIPGEQLWLKIIGPPGCGKTRIAKAISGSEHVVTKSTFNGLFSGWTDDSEDDPGLIPEIAGRTLIVKDADPLLKNPNIERIMAELRDFYDKDASVSFRNRRKYEYRDIKATIIICGTQVLRAADQSFLGERFLSVEMDMRPSDEKLIKEKMMHRSLEVAMGVKKDPEIAIMSSMKGWVNHLKDRKLDSTIDKEFQDNIMGLCSLTALLRTNVDRDFKGRITSPPMSEIPTRLIGQSIVASLALSAVFGVNKAGQEVYSVIQKIHRDTINPRSNRFLICETLLESPGIDAFDLLESTNLPKSTLQEEMADLEVLGFIQRGKRVSDSPGRARHTFTLNPRIATPLRDLL